MQKHTYLDHDLFTLPGVDNNIGTNLFNFGHTSPSKKNRANHFTPSTFIGYSISIIGNGQPARPNVPVI